MHSITKFFICVSACVLLMRIPAFQRLLHSLKKQGRRNEHAKSNIRDYPEAMPSRRSNHQRENVTSGKCRSDELLEDGRLGKPSRSVVSPTLDNLICTGSD
ncbi:hypothetical protein M408DRAFT_89628 [Serendipita vermifera MAFF 305830]|uniref:Secreted protein n=1 Tax=Serendipita vermifera MAFF 305830 TaxID=933852 RepID=A0A0C2X7J5_SERVB|nr:hypothetical protein M408DRAFT_89628 [Serendipita vermifera MAFF 305830]